MQKNLTRTVIIRCAIFFYIIFFYNCLMVIIITYALYFLDNSRNEK